MLHHGRLISTATTSSSACGGAAIIGPNSDELKSTASSSSVVPSLSLSLSDAKMNTTTGNGTGTTAGRTPPRSRGVYGPDDLEPTFVCLTQFDRPLPSTSAGMPTLRESETSTSTSANLGVPGASGATVKSRKPRPTSLPADSQPTLLKTLRSKLRPSTSHTSSSTSRSTSNPNAHPTHQATTPLPVPSPPSSSSMALTPTTPHPPDPHTHLSPHTHALLLPSSLTLYGSSSPHPPPKHALQFIRHLVGASKNCAESLGMNSSLVLQDPERNCCADLGFWVGSVKRGWEGKDGDDGDEEGGEDDEGLSQEMVIERLMLALGLRGWLMVANPMIFPSRLPLRLEELQSLLPPSMSSTTRRPIKKFIGMVGKLEDACEVLLGEGERTGGMAPQFLIGKYRWFEDEEEESKCPKEGKGGKSKEGGIKGRGKMRTAWCGLVSIRSEMRLEGQKWRPARHFSLETRTPPQSQSPTSSHSSNASAMGAGADAGLVPAPRVTGGHSRSNSRSTSTTSSTKVMRSRTHHKRSSSTTLVHALGHTFDHLSTLGHHPLDTSPGTLHLGLTAPRKAMTLVPQRFGVGGERREGERGAGGGLGKLIRMHPYSLILVLVLCLVWEWAWLF